ncbi:MAG: DNA-binding protein [Streptosporangiaceae bacterium]|nr:DNA-binding protein [Streptosporangiaceae bacterium]MBV9853876.1 DNA-binding protein [Streptosporangiaceae bacterium]
MADDLDREQAAREADARARLLGAGASSLPRPPWLARRQPPSAADLIRFALWRSHAGGTGEEDLLAALALLPAARAELDQIETALLFTARAEGLSWSRISRAMGLGSPQAAQQRFGRVTGRAGDPGRR